MKTKVNHSSPNKANNQNKENNINKIPLKDSLFMSPIEKYKIYGRFPWKMIIHVLLVITTTAQVILISLTIGCFNHC